MQVSGVLWLGFLGLPGCKSEAHDASLWIRAAKFRTLLLRHVNASNARACVCWSVVVRHITLDSGGIAYSLLNALRA